MPPSIIRISSVTTDGKSFELSKDFFELSNEDELWDQIPPVVSVCREGIVVLYCLRKIADHDLIAFRVTTAPHPKGLVPKADAPPLDSEFQRFSSQAQQLVAKVGSKEV